MTVINSIECVLNMTGIVRNMTISVLNGGGLVITVTSFVGNVTGFEEEKNAELVPNITGFVTSMNNF